MKTLVALLLFACFAITTNAQTTISKDNLCSFLINVKFKNGADTIVVKGTMVALIQLPPFTIYEETFLRKRGVNIKNIGSSIEFKPEHCSKSWVLPLIVHADKGNFLDHYNGKSIKITCLVFDGYSGYKDYWPYVLVTKAVPDISN